METSTSPLSPRVRRAHAARGRGANGADEVEACFCLSFGTQEHTKNTTQNRRPSLFVDRARHRAPPRPRRGTYR